MRKWIHLTGCFLFTILFAGTGYSQLAPLHLGFYHLEDVSGEIFVTGLYRQQDNLSNTVSESQENTNFTGGLNINTRSYIWSKKFILLDVNGGYSPGYQKDEYLITPERSEVMALRKIEVKTSFYNEKKITLSAYGNYNDSYQNRDNLSNIKSESKQYGTMLYSKTKILPFVLKFDDGQWDQLELLTNRRYVNFQRNISGGLTQSFSKRDNHELIIARDEYVRKNVNFSEIFNEVNRAELNSNVKFDPLGRILLDSRLNYFDQTGSTSFNRIQANEVLSAKLPKNFNARANYRFYNVNQEAQTLVQNNAGAMITHNVDKDLFTKIFAEYSDMNHTYYNQTYYKAGGGFIKYQKRVPTGKFVMSYQYYRFHQDMVSDPIILLILDEEHTLSDGTMEYLGKQYVDPLSIVVTDITGTIIYDIGIDYIIIEREPYMEIQRIPGGQIPDNSLVLIDYSTNQPSSYSYDANNHAFAASLFLFQRWVEIYYRFSTQNYLNIVQSDMLSLNYFSQNVIGAKINWGFGSVGAEYDDYKSNLIPHIMTRYFFDMQKNFNNRIMVSLIGNYRYYNLLDQGINQEYGDLSGRFGYRIKAQTKLNLESGYRIQKGSGLDLEMLTAKLELTSVIRQLYVTVGVETYQRNYLTEKIDFNGAYFRVARKF